MRIAELSRHSGVSVPTIKYYLREGLLPPGTPTGRNQAAYGDLHLQRLRLVRALREVGGLSVASARDVLTALEQPQSSVHELMGQAHRAVVRQPPAGPDMSAEPAWEQARTESAAAVQELGWQVDPDAPALDQLASVMLALRRVERTDLLAQLPGYADAALTVATREVAAAAAADDPATVMANVVTGTVLGDALLAAMRLLAHEHVARTATPAD